MGQKTYTGHPFCSIFCKKKKKRVLCIFFPLLSYVLLCGAHSLKSQHIAFKIGATKGNPFESKNIVFPLVYFPVV